MDDPDALPGNIRLGSEASVLIVPDDGIIPTIGRALMGFGGMMSGFN